MHPPEQITRVFSGTAITASPARLWNPPGDRLLLAGTAPGGGLGVKWGLSGCNLSCCFAGSFEIGKTGKAPS